MITKPTVLVLGAGASKPYSYPTGIELSENIIGQLTVGNQQYNALHNICGLTADQIEQFRRTFFESGKNSIDAFLEHRPDLMPIGKAAIAAVMIAFQHGWHLLRYTPVSWLRYIYNNLNTSFDQFANNRISFITFNYDRTVEHFLFTVLRNTYNKTDEECCKILSQISIIHLHGSLGPLPWQDPSGVPYEATHSRQSMEAAVRCLKIIHEDIRDGRDADFQLAKRLMDQAERILFLGFGYYTTNMERLDLAHLRRDVAYGTSLGLREAERQAIRRACDSTIQLVDCDCITLVRDFMVWN